MSLIISIKYEPSRSKNITGVAGARSVKWLNKITVQEKDSQNFYQQHDYKILPPEATDKQQAEKFWDKIDPL